MLRERWSRLDRETRFVVVLAVSFVVYRTALASLSGFGFHQGWNEGHYALIAQGFLDHPLVPRYADRYVYSVPPLFPYLVAASFRLFGESVLAARLPSVLAGGGLLVSTYALGRELLDRQTALLGAALLAVLPYAQLYGGRTQTDALMVCLTTAALAAILRGYNRSERYRRWLVAGGGLFAAAFAAKQPALVLPGVVLLWLLSERRLDRDTLVRTGTLIGASAVFLLPVAAWLAANYAMNPTPFVADWEHELFGRTTAFANVPLLLAIGLGLGVTPPVLLCAAAGALSDGVPTSLRRLTRNISPLTWWLLLYGGFVFARTPRGHQYYALVLLPPIALFAARGIDVVTARAARIRPDRERAIRVGLVAVLLLSSLGGTVVLFELSGEFSAVEGSGTHVAADAGAFVADDVPDNATLLVENGYAPPVKWYVRNDFPIERVEAYRAGAIDEHRLQQAVAESDGPVYLLAPQPAWEPVPVNDLTATVVHRTEPYDYTVMAAVGRYVDTDSKFTIYLDSRRLVVYRLDESAFDEPTAASDRQ